MAVLERRKDGTVTIPLTLRLSEEAHTRLKDYALKTRQTMALAVDCLILKGTDMDQDTVSAVTMNNSE